MQGRAADTGDDNHAAQSPIAGHVQIPHIMSCPQLGDKPVGQQAYHAAKACPHAGADCASCHHLLA